MIVNHQLSKDENGYYTIDFDRLEAQIDKRTKMIMMCNPHNPAGRVWTREELTALADIAKRHDLIVVSDEIHADFIYSGHEHISIASLSEDMANRTVTAYAPSKTFNLAGLCQSYVVIPNPRMRDAYMAIYDGCMDLGSNVFGMTALTAAYNEAEGWLDQLLVYLEANRDYAVDYIRKTSRNQGLRARGHLSAVAGLRGTWTEKRGAEPVFPGKGQGAHEHGLPLRRAGRHLYAPQHRLSQSAPGRRTVTD